jgi:hypothetical protein
MMNKKFSKITKKGLPGGPNEQFTYVTGMVLQDMYHVPKAQKGLQKYQSKGEYNFNDLIKRYRDSGWDALTQDEKDLYRDNYDNLYYDQKQKSWRSDKPVAQVTADATGRYKELKDYKNFLTNWYSSDMAKNMMTEGYKKEYEGTDYEGSVNPKQLAEQNLQERIKNTNAKQILKEMSPDDSRPALGYVYNQTDNSFLRTTEEKDLYGDVQQNIQDADNVIFDAYMKSYNYDIFDEYRNVLEPVPYVTFTPPTNKLRSTLFKDAYKKAYENELKEGKYELGPEWADEAYDVTEYPAKSRISKTTKKLEDLSDKYRTIFYRPTTNEFTIPHELGHLSTGANNLIPNQDIRLIQEEVPFVSDERNRVWTMQNYGPKDLFGNPISKKNYGNPTEENQGFFRSLPYDYYDNPTEVQTRLNLARFQAKDKIGWDATKRKATMKDVIKLKEVDEANIQDLFDNYTPEHILKMLNSIVMEDQGQDMYYGKKGGEGYRKGAKNYNAPYKFIPSGNITMTEKDGGALKKGPLLGIDNKGNQQMMFPGYEYQFPGDQVMEIPVAQEGISTNSLPEITVSPTNTYNDSMQLYNQALENIYKGKGYDYLVKMYQDYPRYKEHFKKERKDYGKRDFLHYMKGYSKWNQENPDAYDYKEDLHLFELPYTEANNVDKFKNDKIKPTGFLGGPESQYLPLYDKPTGTPPSNAIKPYNPLGLSDYMRTKGLDGSKEGRKKLAKELGFENYNFSEEDNQKILEILENFYNSKMIRAQKGISVKPFAKVFPINEEGYRALIGDAGFSTNIKNKPTYFNTSIKPTFGYSPYDPQKKYNLDLKGQANVGYRVGDFTTELGVTKNLKRSKDPQIQAALGFNNKKFGLNAKTSFPNKDNPNFKTGVNLRYSPNKNLSFTGDFEYDSKMNSPMFNVGATYKFLQNGGEDSKFNRIAKKYKESEWSNLTESEKNYYTEYYNKKKIKGGENYSLGDEVDYETMLKLKKLGYEFE